MLEKINKHSIASFRQYLAMRGASSKSIKRKESSLRQFFDWAVKKGYLKRSPYVKDTPLRLRAYRVLPYLTYFNLIILLVFGAALGFGIYQQFIARAPEPLAYPAEFIRPKRYLSFQGRLTDSGGTPITDSIYMYFYLYNSAGSGSPPAGGILLWDSGECTVNPDDDGIFAILLGTTPGTDYTCSSVTEIPSSVFSENAEIWLQIQVSTQTLSPRIQIATVAYALNAETLQGFPLASATNATPEATMGATARTVPALNPAGNLVIASANPTLWSTSGTFAIKGQALSIVTDTGTGGNITIAPDGTGVLNIVPTSGNQIGGTVNATNSALTTGALYTGRVENDNTGFDFLRFFGGLTPTEKFAVDYAGNVSLAGGTITGANSEQILVGVSNDTIQVVKGAATYTVCDSSGNCAGSSAGIGGSGTANRVAKFTDTYTIGNSGINDLSDALAITIDSSERVGIGTTNPTMKLDVAGNATISGTLSLGPQTQAYAGDCDAPNEGKMYYDAGESKYYYCDGSSWTQMGAGGGGLWTDEGTYIYPSTTTGGYFRIYDDSSVAQSSAVGTSGTAYDLSANSLETGKVLSLSSTSITTGDVLYLAANNGASNAYLIRAQAGSSLSNRLTLDSSGNLKIYDTNGTNSLNLAHDGTNATITSSAGNIEIGSGGGDFLIGETNIGVDIHFAESANIEADDTEVITMTDIGNITPDTTKAYNLGSSSLQWAYLYAQNATLSGTLSLGPQTQAYADPCDAPSKGKMYYENAQDKYYYCNGSSWTAVGTGTGVGGSGTPGKIPKWDTSSSLTDSIIYETGSQIGIGSTALDAKLEVLAASGTHLRLEQTEDTNYVDFTVDGSGNLTIDVSGTKTIIADDLQITGNDIYDSGPTQRINLGATTTLYNTTTTLSGTVTITASSLETFTTTASLAMSSTTSLTFGGSATIYGGTASGGTLTLVSTSHSTKGNLQFFSSSNTLSSSGNLTLAGTLSVAGTKFQVDSNGDIIKLKNLTYSWPSSHVSTSFLRNDGSGNLTWSTDITATSLKWNALTNPDNNLSLSMGANTTTFTWGDATGANNLFTFADTANNTGTGYLVNIATATGTSLKPFRITAKGAEALMVDNAGNVGIGTTTPLAKLDVSGDASVSGNLYLGAGGEIRPRTSGSLSLAYKSGTNSWTPALTVNNLGDVGIGTTSPGDKLDVVGEIDTSTYYKLGNSKILDVENTNTLLVGQGAGSSLVAGADYNTLVGQNAGYSLNNANNDYNTFIGGLAGYYATSGAGWNTYIGYYAGYGASGATTGDYNIGIGVEALRSIEGGYDNIAVGFESGRYITTGYENTLIGTYAGWDINTGIGNVIIGQYAGDNLTTGDYNTIVGSYAYVVSAASDAQSSIALGYMAEITASNQMVVGSSSGPVTDSYWGEGVTSTTPGDFTFNASGGSGTNIAGANLKLASGKATGNATGGSFIFLTSDAGASGTTLQSLSEKMRITAGGNVGIGTTAPLTKLHVSGTTTGKALAIFNETGTVNDIFTASSSGTPRFTISNAGNITTTGTASFNSGGVVIESDNDIKAARFVDSVGSEAYFLDPAGAASLNIAGYATVAASLAVGYSSLPSGPGNAVFSGKVGIGTTAPGHKLQVGSGSGATAWTSAIYDSSDASLGFYNDGIEGYLDATNAGFNLGTISNNYLAVFTNSTEKMRLSAAGGLSLGNSYVGTDAGAGNMIISGNVGIGTTGPAGKVHLAVDNPADSTVFIVQAAKASNPVNSVNFRTSRGTIASPTASQIGDFLGGFTSKGYGATNWSNSGRVAIFGVASENWTDSAQGAYLYFETTATGQASQTEKMRLQASGGLSLGNSYVGTDPGAGSMIISGNVGIGTTGPATLLTIGSGSPTTSAYGIQFGITNPVNLYRSGDNILSIDANDVLTLGQDGGGGAAVAGAGALRLYNNSFIKARNNDNTANLAIAGYSGNTLLLGESDTTTSFIQANAPFIMVRRTTGFTGTVFQADASGENPKVRIQHDRIGWGPGGATAIDTELYRSAADILRTADSLIVDGNLTVSGASYLQGRSDSTLTIGQMGGQPTTGGVDLILPNNHWLRLWGASTPFQAHLRVQGNVETTGNLTVNGTATAADFECTTCIDQGDLKTTTSWGSGTGDANINMNDYTFFPGIYRTGGAEQCSLRTQWVADPGDTVGRFAIVYCGYGSTWLVRWRYVQASRDPEIFAWLNPETGVLAYLWRSEIEQPKALPIEPAITQGLIPIQATVFDKSLLTIDGDELRRNYTFARYDKPENLSPNDELRQIEKDREVCLRENPQEPSKCVTYITHPDIYFGKLEPCADCAQKWAEIEAQQSQPSATSSADIAEYYQGEEVEAGDVITIDRTQSNFLVRSTKSYDQAVVGIVSTSPSQVIGDSKFGDIKLSLAGRVPTKISTINGPIKIGDPITSSEIPGVGMKATKAGPIVGKALETFDPENNTSEVFPCPERDNSSTSEVKCGKIMVFVNVSWYDPDVFLTSTGELQIVSQPFNNETIQQSSSESGQMAKWLNGYIVEDAAGRIIERIGVFSEAVIANLRVGALHATQIITDALQATRIDTEKLVSPLVETGEIKKLEKIEIKGGESGFGKLLIQNEQGETVASIDSAGNASFAGELRTPRIDTDEIRTTRIYADEIISKKGTFGELLAATVSASQIAATDLTEIQTRLATLETQLTGSNPVTATPTPEPDQPEASESALLAEVENWEISDVSQDLKITSNLKVLGRTSLADTTMAGQLMVDGTIVIDSTGINSLPSSVLRLQSSGWGGVDILAGKVVIDVDGNVAIAGNLTVGGELTTQRILLDVPEESKFGKLLEIKNQAGETLASIDSSGSAQFASLAIAADYSATQSAALAEIRTNASSGLGILPASQTEFTIFNPKVSDNTLVYITPVSSTQNKVLYVSAKKAEDLSNGEAGFFKVAIDTPINQDIQFNWWIIN